MRHYCTNIKKYRSHQKGDKTHCRTTHFLDIFFQKFFEIFSLKN